MLCMNTTTQAKRVASSVLTGIALIGLILLGVLLLCLAVPAVQYGLQHLLHI